MLNQEEGETYTVSVILIRLTVVVDNKTIRLKFYGTR